MSWGWWRERARRGTEKFVEEEWRTWLAIAVAIVAGVIADRALT